MFLVSLMILFVACDPTDNNNNGNVTNYWTTNALVRLQLKGAVHTFTQNGVKTEFNNDGMKVRVTFPGSDDEQIPGSDDEQIYTYDAQGRLLSDGSSTFEYNNLGKFIPNSPFHINHTGLTPNLSAMIGDSSRMDYVFVGDTLWMMEQYTSSTETTRDTTKIYYADKYPTNYMSDGEFMRATYQANGMFDVYIDGFYGEEGYTSEHKFTYKKDPQYMLLDKDEVTITDKSGKSYSVTTYTYNEYKDMVASETSGPDSYNITEYYDYEYDAKGNWTSRKIRTKENSEVWGNDRVETRTITYFE